MTKFLQRYERTQASPTRLAGICALISAGDREIEIPLGGVVPVVLGVRRAFAAHPELSNVPSHLACPRQ